MEEKILFILEELKQSQKSIEKQLSKKNEDTVSKTKNDKDINQQEIFYQKFKEDFTNYINQINVCNECYVTTYKNIISLIEKLNKNLNKPTYVYKTHIISKNLFITVALIFTFLFLFMVSNFSFNNLDVEATITNVFSLAMGIFCICLILYIYILKEDNNNFKKDAIAFNYLQTLENVDISLIRSLKDKINDPKTKMEMEKMIKLFDIKNKINADNLKLKNRI